MYRIKRLHLIEVERTAVRENGLFVHPLNCLAWHTIGYSYSKKTLKPLRAVKYLDIFKWLMWHLPYALTKYWR
jgi:hypothetical protein